MTLRDLLADNGIRYASSFSNRAEDIDFDDEEELFEALGYILNHYQRFDFEIPDDHRMLHNAYPIANGMTAGGNEMKYSGEYRIYFRTIRNMPDKLHRRLQNDNRNRITGSLFIESCYYLGFEPGSTQNEALIETRIHDLTQNDAEEEAFNRGYNL